MKTLKFVTATELDPITSVCLNARFVGFLASLSARLGLSFEEVVAPAAQKILEDAEIPQI